MSLGVTISIHRGRSATVSKKESIHFQSTISRRYRLPSWITTTRKPLRIQLYHCHLPKLVKENLIEYDSRSQTIRYHGSDRVEVLLEISQNHEFE
ncbi:DUF7344 domain-containing protein [Haladaptatus pallidirubidus]|uniref:DUF7344 domain-containing protein n=1 Tax=Haladaptatus pallidirubidus TaxID=1008152 RepID=UPI003CD0961C